MPKVLPKHKKPLAKSETNNEALIKKLIRAKEAAEKARAELERSYGQLQDSKDRLVQSEKMAFAGRLAASMAHEIRNPLNMLVMSVQLLQNNLAQADPNRELVDITMRNLERIDRLVTQLVNCARPPKLKMGNYSAHKVIDAVIDTIREKCKAQGIKIVRNYSFADTKIRIDREQIEQAILNVAKNAIEAMFRKGTLTFLTAQEQDYFSISLINTGRGIAGRDMIRIYDPFYTTKKQGTGLGLSICYAIVASHNGFISLKSTPKETCFTIKLPI